MINFAVGSKLILERLTGRRICQNCGKVFHIKYNPPSKSGICDSCFGRLIERKDDKFDTIKKRLAVYYEQSEKLKSYYKGKGKLYIVDGDGDFLKIYASIKKILEEETADGNN